MTGLIFILGSLLCWVGYYFLAEEFRVPIAVAFSVFAAVCVGYIMLEVTRTKKQGDSESERADWAEGHIADLQKHINEQDEAIKTLKSSKEKFRHAAFHDVLTDLPNRSLFIESLKFILEKCKQQSNYQFAVLSLDINRFKTINDSLGHSNGDQLIKEIASRLKEVVRKGDLVARFSGDEFSIILGDIRSVHDAVGFAKIVIERTSAPVKIAGRQIFPKLSIGIAMGNPRYSKADEVLRDADIAMYHAKDAEKEYEIFTESMHTQAVTLLQLETDLRSALDRKEFTAHFQPIIGLNTMTLEGFEALIRWNHPTRGMVSPGDFIPVSEDTGLIIPMTLWMLRHSCERLLEWRHKMPGGKPLFLSVNLSSKHFVENNLVTEVQKILVETQIDPACIKLEITESAMMNQVDRVITMLNEFKALGVQLSIDDFGTGYSSLSYLHRFPVDTLKIDRSFVSTMEDGTENGEIVRTIISLAKSLNLDIVAEGIETIHQMHQLRILGCEYGQGYLFSRPVPPEEIVEMLGDPLRWKYMIPAGKAIQMTEQAPLQPPMSI